MPTLSDLMRTYHYYPSPKYKRKNWAPEDIPEKDLAELARAQAVAVKNGYLTPELAQQFLPNILAEGRFKTIPGGATTFGFNGMGYAPTPDMDAKIKGMGLTVGDAPPDMADQGAPEMSDADFAKFQASQPDVWRDSTGYRSARSDPKIFARLSALMLAKKAQLYGPDKAVERWNGQGPGAVNHAQKVTTLNQMMQDPANAQLLQAYQQYMQDQ